MGKSHAFSSELVSGVFRVVQVLGMVDENFAAGVLYAIDNVYNTTTNVLVYNMGASSTQVSIHQHDVYTVKEVPCFASCLGSQEHPWRRAMSLGRLCRRCVPLSLGWG